MHQTAGQPAKRKFMMQEDDDDIGSESGKLLMRVDKGGKAAQPEKQRIMINEDDDVVSRPNRVHTNDDADAIPAGIRKDVFSEDSDDDAVSQSKLVAAEAQIDIAIPAGKPKTGFFQVDDDDVSNQTGKACNCGRR
ncbi:uncharacterized protein LOC129580605 [Paramacrobiotus metropolitanus]|uniref:uncharacterized protein LOC129580605 n=1 Tax=Paramacrobiotus metropolitanus TaxID=2943436 RepID=UPI00244585C7|nr:uncharacterized protein LOC129580605 [Paramacrobiotus metropolitanus]XP_055327180.1 uncharacterized protein LOC129580605 [Paramacrobiotus metropolitanus]